MSIGLKECTNGEISNVHIIGDIEVGDLTENVICNHCFIESNKPTVINIIGNQIKNISFKYNIIENEAINKKDSSINSIKPPKLNRKQRRREKFNKNKR